MDQSGGGPTPPSGQQQPPPPQQDWQSTPQPPGPPPPAAGGTGSTTMPAGPVAGTTIAEFVPRLIAFIIDAVVLGVVNYVLWMILGGILLSTLGGLSLVVYAIATVAISAGYFIYFWTTRRQTPGMIVMKLMVVEDGTGATLTQSKAIRRWLFLGLPLALTALLTAGGGFGFFGLGGLGGLFILFTLAPIVALIALGWEIYLAYTTYQDPRKQGVHDKAVGSVVVSYGPSPLGGAR